MKRKRKIIFLVIAILCGVAFSTTPTEATLITIEIQAVVDSVSDERNYLEGNIKVGDIITGFYSYDSSTPDRNPSPAVGHYWHYDTPAGISLSVGGFNFQSDSGNVQFLIGVGNDGPSGNDVYWLTSYENLALANGTLVDSIGWQLEDDTGRALWSDVLLLTAPPLGDWQSNHLRLHGQRGGYIIDAHVTSAIPEPETILLFGIGGVLLVGRNLVKKDITHFSGRKQNVNTQARSCYRRFNYSYR